MSSKYEKTQGTQINVSADPATQANPTGATWQSIKCSTKEISYTAGQKPDIETTTLCSTEQEMTSGLPAPGEMTISGNWAVDEGQDTLRTAYDSDAQHAFQVIFPSGNGYAFLAEVRQNSWGAGTAGVVTASFTLRVKGKTVPIVPAPAAG